MDQRKGHYFHDGHASLLDDEKVSATAISSSLKINDMVCLTKKQTNRQAKAQIMLRNFKRH